VKVTNNPENCRDHSQAVVTSAPNSPIASISTQEHSRLLPWLVLCALTAGLALGVSIMMVVNTSQSESRMRVELDKQNRFLQEYRIRVEDAEIAAEEVNPKFHPRRTE
jgi:uncharacterized protein HemX